MANKTGIEILNIMIASDNLNLNQLISKVAEFCMETICFKPEILFNSVNFIDLSAPLLEIEMIYA